MNALDTTDSDGIGNNSDPDDDGVIDEVDFSHLNSNESTDADADGIGDNADPDDDNDERPTLMTTFRLIMKRIRILMVMGLATMTLTTTTTDILMRTTFHKTRLSG